MGNFQTLSLLAHDLSVSVSLMTHWENFAIIFRLIWMMYNLFILLCVWEIKTSTSTPKTKTYLFVCNVSVVSVLNTVLKSSWSHGRRHLAFHCTTGFRFARVYHCYCLTREPMNSKRGGIAGNSPIESVVRLKKTLRRKYRWQTTETKIGIITAYM